ncbi:amino acid permease [Streptomyces sp. HSG2]|nr:amino acid permease [Streptomyces sp. HSG2]
MTAAGVVTDLRGLPALAVEELTMFFYIIMYALMYAAAIRLRRTRPQLPRGFRVPGGFAGVAGFAGVGLLAVGFAFVVSFVPPEQLPVGSPTGYVLLMVVGTGVMTGVPLVVYHLRRPGRRNAGSAGGD